MRSLRPLVFSCMLAALYSGSPTDLLVASDCDWSSSTSSCDCEASSECGCNGSIGCDCSGCCNRGLLDIVDRFAVRIHHRLKRATGVLQTEFGLRTCGQGCDVGCDCRMNPSDGMPFHTDGECDSCSSLEVTRIEGTDELNAVPPVPPSQSEASKSQPRYTGRTQRNESFLQQRLDQDEISAPTKLDLPHVPRRLPTPMKLPDSMVDPFEDEPQSNFPGANRSNERGVQGRTIQYQRGNQHRTESPTGSTIESPARVPNYGQRFDPQAANTTQSADYWSGAEERLGSEPSQVATVSDQPPTLQQIHKRAHSLRLVDQQTPAAVVRPHENPLR